MHPQGTREERDAYGIPRRVGRKQDPDMASEKALQNIIHDHSIREIGVD